MTWQATVNIHNRTQDYSITVTHNTTGDLTTIAPGAEWSWTTEDVNNTMALKFFSTPGVYYMQGSLAFGPEAGVYMDRGWLDPNNQNMTLGADANGTQYLQTQNGGQTVLNWNQFENGGTINMNFFQDQ
jgi:hypothetical protein